MALLGWSAAALAQVRFDEAIRDLSSPDAGARVRTVRMLKDAAYPEAALPLARLVTDPVPAVQLEAIAAELNIFLAEPVVPRRRVGLAVEVRHPLRAEAVFSTGPLAIGARPVPAGVLTALRTASRDRDARVGLEALYAFGVLAVEPGGGARRDLLRASGPELAAFIGSPDPARRRAAVRVMGRVFAKRAEDEAIEPTVGDAVIAALNEGDARVKIAAMEALGAMRDERAVQALTDLFRYYGHGALAEAALDALARIAHPASGPLFAAQLASKTPALKGIAVEGFARLGDARQLGAIHAALAGERNDATRLTGTFASAMLANVPIEPVAEALGRPRLRDQAKAYLAELAPGRTAAFAPLLQDPNARLRADAADALGLGGDATAVSAIEPLARDPDPYVIRAAERALARLRQVPRGRP